jgi:hypothetical protein
MSLFAICQKGLFFSSGFLGKIQKASKADKLYILGLEVEKFDS